MALYLVIQVSAFLSRYIPRSVRYLIGTAVGDAVYMVWGKKRRVARENVATVLGLTPLDPRVRRLARKAMRNYCKYLIEFLELPVMTSADPVIANMKIVGAEHLRAALESGKGVILATAHFGTIEIPGLRLQDFTSDFHAVYDAFTPAYLDRLIQAKRREKGINPIPVGNVREMMRTLKGGGTIALLFDKPVERAKGVAVRFFGRETAVPGGPALLAMKTDATILPVFTFRHPDKSFQSDVLPPVAWTPCGDRDRDMQTIMQRLMDALQQAVRERPDQWYMFRPMWLDQARPVAARRPTAAPDSRQM
jgi:KDO2-lipid IV(A) lauroyltransferase